MSARRWFGGALIAALVTVAAAAPARSQIVARVGGNLAGRIGDTLEVPVTVDLRAMPGVRLGSYRMAFRFNSNVLAEMEVATGSFAPPLVNTDSAYAGTGSVLRLTAVQPSGADSVVTLFVARFMVVSDTGQSDITISFDEMSAAGTFADLLPSLSVVNGVFCHASGRWGDVDGDGLSNSRDALIALSKVVGLPLDTAQIIVIDSLHSDTIVTMRPGLADVDGDGQITSRDALVIVSYAVGLPVPGFRIGLAAAGACGSGLGITLAAAPDTLDLQSGQSATVVVSARDGAGQAVSLNGATWTSSNSAVAGAVGGFGVEARDPGVAVLTVRLGPGYSASMVVRVIAHRSQWYVDAARSQAPLQTGSAAFPFAFIQDAFDAGRDADTVNIAAGVYEEAVSSDISMHLRGDPANLPVIDARGAAYYSPYTAALSAGSRASRMVIENLAVRAGHVVVNAHDFAARNLQIEGDTLVAPLYFASLPSLASSDTGSVVLDSVRIHGYAEGSHGIEIALADSVSIRRSTVARDVAGETYCFPSLSSPAGIYVGWAAHTEIRNTAVTNSPCMGMAVQQPAGSALFSANTVAGLAGAGIAVSAPQIAFDHNLIRDALVPGYSNSGAAGIWVTSAQPVQAVSSLGDVIRNVGATGVWVQSAAVVTVDSLVADSIGLDGGYGYAGVDAYDARTTVAHSRIAHVPQGVGISVWAGFTNNHAVLESRHNVVQRTGDAGIFASRYGSTPRAPRALPGPPIQRDPMGASNYGPDTVISVGDSVRFTAGPGIAVEDGLYLLLDTAAVDSALYDGVSVSSVGRVVVRGAHVRRVGGTGLYLYTVDTALVVGTAVDSSASDGLYLNGSVVASVDSSRFAGNAAAGIHTYCGYCTGLATITRSTIAGNGTGLFADGFYGGLEARVRGNNITGNGTGGATNPYYVSLNVPLLDADTNYWGSALGPRCSATVGACNASGGDSILTTGVSFAGWLAAAPTNVMTAPPFIRPVARTASPTQLAATAMQPPPPAASTARSTPAGSPPELQPRPPLVSYRRGRPPQPARVHHPS